jgi:hypothetical protein
MEDGCVFMDEWNVWLMNEEGYVHGWLMNEWMRVEDGCDFMDEWMDDEW